MASKTITIQDFANHFGLVCISGDLSSMQRPIEEVSVNRPGLELAGFFDYPRSKRLIFLGNKEMKYISTMKEEDMRKAFEFLLEDVCPGLVICQGHECPPLLLEIAKVRKFPIFLSNRQTNDLNMDTVVYLYDALAPTTSLHAALVEMYSSGVLILGESGIGKSEVTLELIKKGHNLVSDDRVNISSIRGKLYGEAPELLVGMMEVRGIGIVDVTRMFGINTLVKRTEISFAIKLVKFDPSDQTERIGKKVQYLEILNQKIPMLTIPVYAGRSVAELVEVAVTNLKLKQFGYDSSFEFENRLNELLSQKKGGR